MLERHSPVMRPNVGRTFFFGLVRVGCAIKTLGALKILYILEPSAADFLFSILLPFPNLFVLFRYFLLALRTFRACDFLCGENEFT
jgi:hypothetical protein